MTPLRPALPRVLSIAGTDPSGGAGTAADTKSISAAGGFAMTAVTCLVAQNTTGVQAVHTPPSDFLSRQLRSVSDDVELDVVKTGMLGTTEIITAVGAWLDENPPAVLVVDPVMVATSGDRLLEPEAEEAMRRFCERATVITPNIPELAVLLGTVPARTWQEAVDQARQWARRTRVPVVVKTGHLVAEDGESGEVLNIWVDDAGVRTTASAPRVETASTHGTGCSLASALATRLGAGDAPEDALAWTTQWLHEAVAHGSALRVGTGHGPVDHFHRARRLADAGLADPWAEGDGVPAELSRPEDLAPEIAPAPLSIAAAGPWTRALWRASSDIAREISTGDFVAGLVEGTLPVAAFDHYLAQDALYLEEYSRALALLAARAPRTRDAIFWARAADTVLSAESELHRTWLAGRPRAQASPVTRAYTDFLIARAAVSPYAVGAGAALPCHWLYAEIGAAVPQVDPDHRFAAWLSTYHDPAFAAAAAQAVAAVEEAMKTATPAERAQAARAYLLASRHELEFFDQALRLRAGGSR